MDPVSLAASFALTSYFILCGLMCCMVVVGCFALVGLGVSGMVMGT